MVTIEFLLELKENNEKFKIVEALTEKAYNKGHIPGADFLPINLVEEKAPKILDKQDKIIVYCTGYSCKSSTSVARKLLEMGYTEVYDFKAGKLGWKKAGLKLEGEIS